MIVLALFLSNKIYYFGNLFSIKYIFDRQVFEYLHLVVYFSLFVVL